MIITRKIQIACKNKDDYSFLQDMLKECRLMANKVMTNFYITWQDGMDSCDKDEKIGDYFKDKHDCSFRNTGYQYLTQRFPKTISYLRRDVSNQAYQDFRADIKNGLLKGERSLRIYRNGTLPLHNQNMSFRFEDDEIILKWIKGIELVLVFGRDDSNNRIIVSRIIDGSYKLSGSKIVKDWRKGKWFLLLCVDIPERENELLDDVSVGVDLGIAVPAVCALNKGNARAYIGNNILLKRFSMQKKQRGRQKSYIPANSEHGRQKVDKAIYKMQDKERRFVHSFNHKITREIIKFALKHRASTILTEDLSGFGKDGNKQRQTILRNWSFYELQEMLFYKAKQENIKVVKIPAKYTSRACSVCGYIDKDNRKTQSQFKCLECGFESNADYNAALNIARGGVKLPKEMLEATKNQTVNSSGACCVL